MSWQHALLAWGSGGLVLGFLAILPWPRRRWPREQHPSYFSSPTVKDWK